MQKTYNLIRSRTFWTIVVMAVVGAGNAIVPVVPADYQAIVLLILSALASYFHLETGRSTTGTN